MRIHPDVHFHEGMLLLPHHFQAFSRGIASQLEHNQASFGPCRWGVEHLDLEVNPVEVRIAAMSVVLESGLRVSFPGNARLEPRKLEGRLESNRGILPVYLGVPQWQEGVPALAADKNSRGRYHTTEYGKVDENTADPDSETGVHYRLLNAQILIGQEDDLDGFDVVKIAEIVRKSDHDPTPVCSKVYVPPLLDVTADSNLRRMLGEVLDALAEKAEGLANLVTSEPLLFALETGAQPENILKLNAINAHYAVVRQSCLTRGVHPFDAYRRICALAGSLAIFSPERYCPEFPLYDHADIAGCFSALTRKVLEYLSFTFRRDFDTRRFVAVGDGEYQECEFLPLWLDPQWELFLGVLTEERNENAVIELVMDQVKLMAGGTHEAITKEIVGGIELEYCKSTPRTLPGKNGLYYFRFNEADTVRSRWQALHTSSVLRLDAESGVFERAGFELYVGKRA